MYFFYSEIMNALFLLEDSLDQVMLELHIVYHRVYEIER